MCVAQIANKSINIYVYVSNLDCVCNNQQYLIWNFSQLSTYSPESCQCEYDFSQTQLLLWLASILVCISEFSYAFIILLFGSANNWIYWLFWVDSRSQARTHTQTHTVPTNVEWNAPNNSIHEIALTLTLYEKPISIFRHTNDISILCMRISPQDIKWLWLNLFSSYLSPIFDLLNWMTIIKDNSRKKI